MRAYKYMPNVLLSFLLMSCIDDTYDLKDVDYTIGSIVDLTLPACSTGDITLKSLMNLKQDGIVKVVEDPSGVHDSIFVVRKSGKADIKPIKIDPITIKKPTVKDFTTTANLLSRIKRRLRGTQIDYKDKESGSDIHITIPTWEYNYKIDSEKAKTSLTNATATYISTDVLRIENITCDDVTVTIKLTTNGIPEWIPYLHLDGLELYLPKDICITRCVLDGIGIEAHKIKAGHIQLTEPKDTHLFNTKELVLSLTFNKAKTGENFEYDRVMRTASISGDFRLGGTIRFCTDDMDEEKLNAKLATVGESLKEFVNSPNKDISTLPGIIPNSITLNTNITFDKDIHITKVTGDFQHVENSLAAVNLNDLPNFLNSPDVVLDIDNPMIYMTLSSEFSGHAYTYIKLKSNTNKETLVTEKSVDLYGILFGEVITTDYYLSEKWETRYIMPDHSYANWREVKNLKNLIRKIPPKIDIGMDTIKISCNDLDITKTYNVDAKYDVFIPFAFGPNFQLVYQETLRNWNLGENIGKLDASMISVTARITNSMPADVLFTVVPIDEYGNEINALEVGKIYVNASAQDKLVQVDIKPTLGHTIKDVLAGENGINKLDGMTYRAMINNPSEKDAISSDVKIKISDIKVSIKGQVSYDAN